MIFNDFRAVNNALLDTYQLKSQDGIDEKDVRDIALVKTADGKLTVNVLNRNNRDNYAYRQPYDHVIRCLGWMFDKSIFST